MSTSSPQTAAEALEAWRNYDKWLEDDGGSPGYIEEMCAEAKRVTELTTVENPLEQLVQDETERLRLIGHAKEYDAMLKREDEAYDFLLDDPLEHEQGPDNWFGPEDPGYL